MGCKRAAPHPCFLLGGGPGRADPDTPDKVVPSILLFSLGQRHTRKGGGRERELLLYTACHGQERLGSGCMRGGGAGTAHWGTLAVRLTAAGALARPRLGRAPPEGALNLGVRGAPWARARAEGKEREICLQKSACNTRARFSNDLAPSNQGKGLTIVILIILNLPICQHVPHTVTQSS